MNATATWIFATTLAILLLGCASPRRAIEPPWIHARMSVHCGTDREIFVLRSGAVRQVLRDNCPGPGLRKDNRNLDAAELERLFETFRSSRFHELTDDSVWPETIVTDEPHYMLSVSIDGLEHQVMAVGIDRDTANQDRAEFRRLWESVVQVAPEYCDLTQWADPATP